MNIDELEKLSILERRKRILQNFSGSKQPESPSKKKNNFEEDLLETIQKGTDYLKNVRIKNSN